MEYNTKKLFYEWSIINKWSIIKTKKRRKGEREKLTVILSVYGEKWVKYRWEVNLDGTITKVMALELAVIWFNLFFR